MYVCMYLCMHVCMFAAKCYQEQTAEHKSANFCRFARTAFRLAYLDLTLAYSKDQLGRLKDVLPTILTFLK